MPSPRRIDIAFDGERHRIDLTASTGKAVTVYGQTEVTPGLMEARDATGLTTIYEAEDVTPSGFDVTSPKLTWKDGTLDADFIAGCDGYHGVARQSVPASAIKLYERIYDTAWLGLLAEVPPVHDELIYACHDRGFALCSMRSHTRSRYYVQVPANTKAETWTDDAFWDELRRRLPEKTADRVVTANSIEKSVAVLRSFVAEPLNFGRLFLCGDAGHIVPPTGAKGLNLAASDVHYLFEALSEYYADHSDSGLNAYSSRALARVWKAERLSAWMTSILHNFPAAGEFTNKLQRAELSYLVQSDAARASLAEKYVGLAF